MSHLTQFNDAEQATQAVTVVRLLVYPSAQHPNALLGLKKKFELQEAHRSVVLAQTQFRWDEHVMQFPFERMYAEVQEVQTVALGHTVQPTIAQIHWFAASSQTFYELVRQHPEAFAGLREYPYLQTEHFPVKSQRVHFSEAEQLTHSWVVLLKV